MKSGRYIGVMSGTSLDGVDVVLAAIDDRWWRSRPASPGRSHSAERGYSEHLPGQPLTLSQLGQLDTRLGALFADAVLALMRKNISVQRISWLLAATVKRSGMNPPAMRRTPCKLAITTRSPR
jgi:anhydro-N-acetylmuramic acid kinase